MANGYFSSNGRISYIYQGANTTFTFANGTEATFENFARVLSPMSNVTDGESFLQYVLLGEQRERDIRGDCPGTADHCSPATRLPSP